MLLKPPKYLINILNSSLLFTDIYARGLMRTSPFTPARTGPDRSSSVLSNHPPPGDRDRDRGQDRCFCSPSPVLASPVPVFFPVPDQSWDRTLQHYFSRPSPCEERYQFEHFERQIPPSATGQPTGLDFKTVWGDDRDHGRD